MHIRLRNIATLYWLYDRPRMWRYFSAITVAMVVPIGDGRYSYSRYLQRRQQSLAGFYATRGAVYIVKGAVRRLLDDEHPFA